VAMRTSGLAILLGAAALLSACGPASIATPQSAPSSATAAPTSAAQTSTSQPTAVPASTTSPPTTASAGDGSTALVIDASGSHATYHAHEQLVGRNLPSDAVGTSNAVSGSIVLNPDGSVDPAQSQIKVDLSKLASDESRRDNFIKGNTLQTNQFPTATFIPRQVEGLPTPLPTSGQATFQLSGDLTVHGVTRPATWQVTAQFDSGTVSGDATTEVNISDFGMSPPKAGPVLSIQDGLTLELAFTASREG
jgi:polyisoprenoid-binding protein YceI